MFKEKEAFSPVEVFKTQVENQILVFKETGVVKILEKSESFGIVGIDGKEYPVPTLEEIGNKLEKKKSLIKKKRKEGFDKMILVPFGKSLNSLIDKYEDAIVNCYKGDLHQKDLIEINGKKEKEYKNAPDPFWRSTDFENPDTRENGRGIIYFPERLDFSNHGGKTKKEILKENDNAWQLWFVNESQNKIGLSPDKSLSEMEEGELGLIPEVEITRAILEMKGSGEFVKGDFQCSGAFFPRSGCGIPRFHWSQSYKKFFFTLNYDPSKEISNSSINTGVRI